MKKINDEEVLSNLYLDNFASKNMIIKNPVKDTKNLSDKIRIIINTLINEVNSNKNFEEPILYIYLGEDSFKDNIKNFIYESIKNSKLFDSSISYDDLNNLITDDFQDAILDYKGLLVITKLSTGDWYFEYKDLLPRRSKNGSGGWTIISEHTSNSNRWRLYNFITGEFKSDIYRTRREAESEKSMLNSSMSNFSERIKKCFSLIYHVRLTDKNDKSKSVSIDNLEAGTWQEAVDKVIADHPEFGLKPGDYDGSDEVEVHWNYDGKTLKSF